VAGVKIPVFLSCPTILNPEQTAVRDFITHEMHQLGLEPRAIGRSDYPADFPLREVLTLARHCSGGVILGFEQFVATAGTWKPKTEEAETVDSPVGFATPWNQIEAGVLFALGKPLLIFRGPRVRGGVFDSGVTDVFVQGMPELLTCASAKGEGLRGLLLRWQEKVRRVYYGE